MTSLKFSLAYPAHIHNVDGFLQAATLLGNLHFKNNNIIDCDDHTGTSPFTISLDDPDLVFGENEVGIRPNDDSVGCEQQRINRFLFDLIVDRELILQGHDTSFASKFEPLIFFS